MAQCQSTQCRDARAYPVHLLASCRKHMDEDRRHHSRRHGWNVGDERQRCGAFRVLFRSWLWRELLAAPPVHGRRELLSARLAQSASSRPTARAFFLTGVKLEIGSVATPFNRQSLAKSMADCQRYYQINGDVLLARLCYRRSGMCVMTS